MSEPLKLPANPTLKDVAHGLQQTHDCLDAARAEIRQNTRALAVIKQQNELYMPGLIALGHGFQVGWRFGKWLGPVVIAAVIGAWVNGWFQYNALYAQTHRAAVSSQAATIVAAKSHAIVSHRLVAPGGP